MFKCMFLKTSLLFLLSHVWFFSTTWTAARQASLSFTISQSLLKLMSIESGMPSNHLILCHPHLPLPSIFPIIRIFSNELALCIMWPKYWTFSFNISPTSSNWRLIRILTVHGSLRRLDLLFIWSRVGKSFLIKITISITKMETFTSNGSF